MNIIELCLSPAKGGLELYASRCAIELSKTENVIGVLSEKGALKEIFANEKIKSLNSRVFFKPFPLLSALKLAKFYTEYNIDLVHVHWVKDLPLVAIAKKISRNKPRIVFTRQMQITRDKKDFYHRFIYKEIDKFIAITKRVASDLKKYLPDFCSDKIEVLYYGVPEPVKFLTENEKILLRKELGIGENVFLVGLFGRIKKEKGQYLLIDAIQKLQDKDDLNASALIVGHPMNQEYLDDLKMDVKRRNLADKVKFKGFINNPQAIMQACDVIVLATYEETFGLVLAEAMRAGVAVVGSNSGGVPEIINHKEDGMLFTTKDSNDLYHCLKLLMADKELAKEIASKGKLKADVMFNDKNHFIKLREILKKINL